MGDIIEITCKKCFHIWQYPIGCGMLHGRLDYVSELFSKEIQTQINELVREKRFPMYDFSYKVGRCDGCKNLKSVPVLFVEQRTFTGACPECGGTVIVEKGTNELECPVCGEPSLEQEFVGLWD